MKYHPVVSILFISLEWPFVPASETDSIGEGTLPVHAFQAPGTYTVTLTVTDPWGLYDSVSRGITVTPAAGGSANPLDLKLVSTQDLELQA